MFENFKKNQKIVFQILKNSFKNNKFNHAYLLVSEKTSTALEAANFITTSVLCDNDIPCLTCDDCLNALKLSHSNIYVIDEDSKNIKKDSIKSLQNEFSKKSFSNKPKIFIIKEADKLNDFASNSLLKFIEEPNENEIGIFIVQNENKILPTIISRCLTLKLNPEPNNEKIENLSVEFNLPYYEIEILFDATNDLEVIEGLLSKNENVVLFNQIKAFIENSLHPNFNTITLIVKEIQHTNIFISLLTEVFRRIILNLEIPLEIGMLVRNCNINCLNFLDILYDLQNRMQYNSNITLQLERLSFLLKKQINN